MISDYYYRVTPTFSKNSQEVNELNKLYIEWKNFWSKILENLNSSLSRDDFSRCSFIGSIWHKNKIAAIHLYGFHNFSSLCFKEHSYIQSNFTKSFLTEMAHRKYKTAISLEYLSVLPEYQKSKELPLGKIMLGLSFEFYKQLPQIDVAFGITRDSRHVNDMVTDFGGEVIESGIYKNGESSSLTIGHRSQLKSPSSTTVDIAIKDLWAQQYESNFLNQDGGFNEKFNEKFKAA